MTEVFELQAQNREGRGTGAARYLRREKDQIPAVIYGGESEPQHLVLEHTKILRALENEAFYSHILTIDIAGKKQKAVLKAIQRHPYKPKILHLDFQRISAKEKITMHVPLHFIGADESPAQEKQGIISHLLNSVDVTCLPKDLPEYIEVDVSKLDIDDSIHLSDLKVPQGVELIDLQHDNDKPVVNAHMPRKIEVVEEIAPEEKAAEEPQQIPPETAKPAGS